jgi:hypothetical protein
MRPFRRRRSDAQHGGTVDPVVGQVHQRLVDLVEAIGLGGDLDRDPSRQIQELAAVLTGVGGDADQRSLLEEMLLIVQSRYVAQIDAGHGQGAATIQGGQRHRHQLSHRSEENGRVQWLGRPVLGRPHAVDAQLPGQLPGLGRTGEDVDAGTLEPGDLGGEMRGATESVDAESPPRGQIRPTKGAVADDPGAEERSHLLVTEDVG